MFFRPLNNSEVISTIDFKSPRITIENVYYDYGELSFFFRTSSSRCIAYAIVISDNDSTRNKPISLFCSTREPFVKAVFEAIIRQFHAGDMFIDMPAIFRLVLKTMFKTNIRDYYICDLKQIRETSSSILCYVNKKDLTEAFKRECVNNGSLRRIE